MSLDSYSVGEVAFVELFEDDRGKPKGSGIVEFEKVEHARIALEKMNRYELKGRRLVVKEVRIAFAPLAHFIFLFFLVFCCHLPWQFIPVLTMVGDKNNRMFELSG